MPSTASPRTLGRPRDLEVEVGILAATQDLLADHGYAGTTIEAVARRARCGKSAIYRRWTTKAELVVAAVSAAQRRIDLPDTGDLREDLLAVSLHFSEAGDRAGLLLARILSEIGHDRELYEAAYETIGGPPVTDIVHIIERWIDRGQVSPGIPVQLVASIVPTAAFGSVTLRQRALDPQHVTDLVDHILLPALAQHPTTTAP